MMINQMNQAQLLHWIDMVSFAVVDITEYLDTHPKDEEALKYFDEYLAMRKNALCSYAEKYGPLTIDSVAPEKNDWIWSAQPLPWEGGSC